MALAIRQLKDLAATQQLAVEETYQRIRVPVLTGGMRLDKPPTELELTESPSMTNVILLNNELRPDTGYTLFGDTLTGAFYGTVQIAYQIFNTDGTTAILLVTTETVYTLLQATMQWQVTPLGAFLSNSGQISQGVQSAGFASVAGVVVGSVLGLPLDDGTQLPVKVTGIIGTVLSWDTAIPAGRYVPVTSNVVLGIKLAGTSLNQVSAITFSPKSWIIFSNNIDPIFYYDGSKLIVLVGGGASDLPLGTTCAWMAVFHECLFLFDTTEVGTQYPQRVRMSDLGDPTKWTPGSGSSIAAIYDLLDTEDFINSATIIGPYLILYRETTIMRGTYIGLLNNTIFWEYMIYGEGLTSVGAVSELGSEQEFVGNGGIYQYGGGYTLDSVGDAVFVSLFSAVGDMNAAVKATIFTQYVPDYDEFWLFYPHDNATAPDKMLRHSLETNAWSVRFFANKFVSATPYIPVQSNTWATWAGLWSGQTASWNSRIFLANVASILLCASDVNKVYIYDYKAQTDAGATIEWSFETKDIAPGDEQYRWDSVRLYGKGTALVEYSTDGGTTFASLGQLALGATKTLKTLYFQAVSSYIRFRISGTDPDFVFNWLECWYLNESEW